MSFKRRIDVFIKATLLITISCSFIGQGCPILDLIMQDILAPVTESARSDETFETVVIDFNQRGCDESIDWFCDSIIADKIRAAIIEGVKKANEVEPKISYKDKIIGDDAISFYATLSTAASTKERRIFCSSVAKNNSANFIIFGYFQGDDLSISFRPFCYTESRQVLAKGENQYYKREDQDFDKKISECIRDLLLRTFNG